ncbi:MAG TPA: mandelate racemase/muconate lactonizing enzyme family protein [Patescibacteria group bacterium]|nr:mandelate racemase/muconate lactonizing enzyme family protein [Patescibacteria group bacterium]
MTGAMPAEAGLRLDDGSLVIDRVETLALRIPLDRRYSGSAYSMTNRCTIITRLHTRDGLVSQVYNGDTDDEQPMIIKVIHEELAPRILGRSAADPERLWSAMEPATNDILRDRAIPLQAISCIDTAAWDLIGRALELPIRRVWGSLTDELPMSVIGGYYHVPPDELPDLLDSYRSEGFGACKFKVGGRTPAEDERRVRAAHEAAPTLVLMVDANQGWNRAEAVEFGKRVGDLRIRWFEEPCRWTNDRRWMRDVRLQTGIPVCAGQSETTLAGLRDLIVDAAIDVSNLDVSWTGGPTIWRKAAGLCAAFGVEIGHHEEPQIAGQLLASVPEGTFVECFDRQRDPVFWRLTQLAEGIADGRLRLPMGPGFGLEFDDAFAEGHVIDRRVTQ